MPNCLNCNSDMPEARKNQKFCCPKFRYEYHNKKRANLSLEKFARELAALMRKYQIRV